MNINKELLKKSQVAGIKKALDQGLRKSDLKRIADSNRILGDVQYVADQLNLKGADFDAFFTLTRKHGIDNSVDLAYGGSTVPSINGLSPFVTPRDVYMEMKGLPYESEEEEDGTKEDIFFAGHEMEKVYRHYFQRMYGDKYTVIDTDLQFNSKKWKHFVMNVDGLLVDKETGQLGVLEIKHCNYNNRRMIETFQDQKVPAHYETQGRCYVEGLDADFVVFLLGWGNRPTNDDLAPVRLERDSAIAGQLLDACEAFIEYNVKKGNEPSYTSVRDRDLIRKNIEKVFGPVDHMEPPMEFDEKGFKDSFNALMKSKEVYDKKKDAEKAAKKETEAAEKDYEQYQLAFIEALKTAPYGYYENEDGRYLISYDVSKTVNVDKLMIDYPDVYDKVKKPAIDTPALKKNFPSEYRECFEPREGGKRRFTVKKVRSRKK